MIAIPPYEQFIEPLLRLLDQHPDGLAARDAYAGVARSTGLTSEQMSQLLPSAAQPVYQNRIGWAHDRLKRAGYSSTLRRGVWQVTAEGRAYAAAAPRPFSAAEVARIATVRPRESSQLDESGEPLRRPAAPPSVGLSPDDMLGTALDEIRASVERAVLDELRAVSPTHFERIVLELLHRMGYGTERADLDHVGRPGDGGIDGVISLDKLGFEKVYVQAKKLGRDVPAISRPDVQAFYGALAGQRATKGVFISTGRFSQQAIEYAASLAGLLLVDGERLARLMVDHEVGVSSRLLRVPRLDRDYFDT